MKLSARNQIMGRVIEIKEGVVAAKVVIDIGGGNKITSTITMDSLKELDLRVGTVAYAIIKSSSVMIGVNDTDLSGCSMGCDA